MKKEMKKGIWCVMLGLLTCLAGKAQQTQVASVSASANASTISYAFDGNRQTSWKLPVKELAAGQWLMFSLQQPGDVKEITLEAEDISKEQLHDIADVFVTYDPMNLGVPLSYSLKSNKDKFILSFPPKYGAHIKIVFKKNHQTNPLIIREIGVTLAKSNLKEKGIQINQPYMNPELPVEERVKNLLSQMTPADKMELIREGWGIPGIPHLGIPAIMKVEAVHGFSYGSGATIFPQAIGMGATWNKQLAEEVAGVIGDETVSAHAKQAWSPVLDVAQDARWGRCEETFGEDPVLVSEIGGAWIKGYQSKGLWTTPKHFAGHGAPLGGRDSHDIGLSEREMREIHLVPFRHVIRNYDCQSLMMAYSDYQGVPVAKSKELLKGILRDEWGFDGFIVSDCGAISNLTSRKHYTAKDKIEAANQALSAGIATNCGDTYNDKEVIEAAKTGKLDMNNLDYVCRTMLRTLFRNGLFEYNPSQLLDWNKIYPGWNSPEHKEVARRAACESMVLLENKNNILPLSKTTRKVAVIGPGADDLQPGDYTPKLQPGQLVSVLSGIKAAVGKQTQITYEKGCDFFYTENSHIDKAIRTAQEADMTILVLGDCSTSEALSGIKQTSGENRDLATLVLPGDQQKLLEAVCQTGKPVILVLQIGRPYNLTYASEHCQAILVNWFPGQEGGPATADVLFGDYNPAGRLPMTFPRNVGQLPLYYNFKTSGRVYDYVDMEYQPLYRFGYGLSYTSFSYSDLKTRIKDNGNVEVEALVTNTGKIAGDEVVQLYVTDMYASVKTRIMELKDFSRINLQPGESKVISFTLTPYQLSILNDNMDRVVEKGEFKIMIGGKSPSYVAADKIKDSVGFENHTNEGTNASIEYPYDLHADFSIRIAGIEENLINKKKQVLLDVKNEGSLMDIGKVTMFVDGMQTGDIRHYELAPGEKKQIRFELSQPDYKHLLFTSKYKSVSLD